jgi:hypothetical protein
VSSCPPWLTCCPLAGSCPRGPRCRFTHDAARVAICKSFLKGTCVLGAECDLSHDATPQRTPTCLHHARGSCTNAKCIYAHSSAPLAAPLCRDFGYLGYCDAGDGCAARHVLYECPDFTNSGKCAVAGCKLLHRERASVMRRAGNDADADAAAGGGGGGDDDHADDVSSDEEVADSDDVDSDAAEEFIRSVASGVDADFVAQRDYIAF